MKVSLGKIFYPKGVVGVDSNEFAIFAANVISVIDGEYEEEAIKLKGNVPNLRYGNEYKVWCHLAENNNWGETYVIDTMNRIFEIKTKEDQMTFLQAILPYQTVQDMFNEYDDIVPLLETKNIEALTKIKGIGEYRANEIIQEYEATKDNSIIYLKLKDAELTSVMINKLVNHYGSPDAVVDIVQQDPYSLVEVDGIGFAKADDIARKMGIEPFAECRVRGFLLYLLKEKGEEGKSYLSYDEILDSLYSALGEIPEDIVSEVASNLLEKKQIVLLDEGEKIALSYFYNLEKNIFIELTRLQKGISNKITDSETESNDGNYVPNIMDVSEKDISELIKESEFEQGFAFTDEQKEAIYSVRNNNVIAITGSAGTGKTSTALGICNVFRQYNIQGCALSGQAAYRLQQATKLHCATIHRTLNWMAGEFKYNAFNKLPVDVLIVDESTMVNGSLFYSLLKAVPTGAKVIMLGDIQQLTPIGNCQVFADILKYGSDVVASNNLSKIHRQAAKSGIITASVDIVQQKQIFDSTFNGKQTIGELKDLQLDIYKERLDLSEQVVTYYVNQMKNFDSVMDVQVCVPKRINGSLSCYNLNTKIQNQINPRVLDEPEISVFVRGSAKKDNKKYVFRVGDKVINRKNDYKARKVISENYDEDEVGTIFNGSMGIIESIVGDLITINFFENGRFRFNIKQAENLELAYACTIHSLQGSGFKSVIVTLDNSSFIMLNCEILYTAITRAKKNCILVGNNYAIRKAINTKETKTKSTLLGKFLSGELLIDNTDNVVNENIDYYK